MARFFRLGVGWKGTRREGEERKKGGKREWGLGDGGKAGLFFGCIITETLLRLDGLREEEEILDLWELNDGEGFGVSSVTWGFEKPWTGE